MFAKLKKKQNPKPLPSLESLYFLCYKCQPIFLFVLFSCWSVTFLYFSLPLLQARLSVPTPAKDLWMPNAFKTTGGQSNQRAGPPLASPSCLCLPCPPLPFLPLLFFFIHLFHFPILSDPSHNESLIQKRAVTGRASPQCHSWGKFNNDGEWVPLGPESEMMRSYGHENILGSPSLTCRQIVLMR